MADDILQLDGKTFYSSKKAAEEAGYTRDYISRLCRNDKVDARRVGRSWFVQKESLEDFVAEQTRAKEQRRKKLSKKLSDRFDQHSFNSTGQTEAESAKMEQEEARGKQKPDQRTLIERPAHALVAGSVALALALVFGWFSLSSLNPTSAPEYELAAAVSADQVHEFISDVAGGAMIVSDEVGSVFREIGPTLREDVLREYTQMGAVMSRFRSVSTAVKNIFSFPAASTATSTSQEAAVGVVYRPIRPAASTTQEAATTSTQTTNEGETPPPTPDPRPVVQ